MESHCLELVWKISIILMLENHTRMKRNYEFSCLKLGIMKYELLFKYVMSVEKNMSINHKSLATKRQGSRIRSNNSYYGPRVWYKSNYPSTKLYIQVENCLLRHKNIYPSIEILSQYNIRFDSASINPDRIVREMN